ncbi:MAG: extracellular solute-binding protein [Hyphomicrobiaceae bacterium]
MIPINVRLGNRALQNVATALVICVIAMTAFAGRGVAGQKRHGLSAFATLKYPADFAHFDYVNPDAPKGGKMSMIGTAGIITFDTFNPFILKGDAAQGLSYLFDSLMVRATDEPDSMYGLVAESASVAEDAMSVTFHLRDGAKFSDGTPVTVDDVVFSFETLKAKGHPSYRSQLRDVSNVEVLSPKSIRYNFKGDLTRDLPVTVAGLPILSKAFYTANDFTKSSLLKPVGSGPYKIGKYKAGTFIIYERRDDYWAKDLPVNKGRFNFNQLRYEYYRDRTAELEALKAGSYDLREEFTSVDWATAYNIKAVKDGRLRREVISDENPSGTQGFFINTRRPKLSDSRVREALGLAFDFEWSNKNLFYGLYKRTSSYFENSDMKAEGLPSPNEIALLEPFRDKLPKEIFTSPPVMPPVSNGSGSDRKLLRKASNLLTAAGWTIENGKRVNAKGEPLDIEILTFSSSFDRIIGPYVENLKRIGVNATLRRVDAAQYQRRVKSFDFDITTRRYIMRLLPGVELTNYFGSASAKTDGSFNLAGISDPVVDSLIAKVMAAKTRNELRDGAKALDRVLRAAHYWVPHWYKASHNLAFWDTFARPETKPRFARGVIDTWWFDDAKARTLKRNN